MVSAQIVSSENITRTVSGLQGPQNITHERLTLKTDSVMELTTKVDLSTGVLATNFPTSNGTSIFYIFPFYEKRTGKRNLQFEGDRPPSSIWDNGSFVVDHFSGRGAGVITNFWEKHILSHARIKELLMEVGNLGKMSFSFHRNRVHR